MIENLVIKFYVLYKFKRVYPAPFLMKVQIMYTYPVSLAKMDNSRKALTFTTPMSFL